MKMLQKHILEIRFTPTPSIVDKRGVIAESLVGDLLNGWSIGDNRINFTNKENKNFGAFVSYKNFGFISESPNDTDFFSENSKDFVKKTWNYIPTGKITRIGVRSTYLVEQSNFEKALENLKKEFLNLNGGKLEKFGGKLVDVGLPLNFKEGDVKFNINFGVMEKEQSSQFFIDEESVPDCGVFIDVDYFQDDNFSSVSAKQSNILQFIDNGLTKSKNVMETVLDLVSVKESK